jgi:hypothetical protein
MCDVPTVTITSRPGPSFLNTNFQTYLGAVVSTPGTLVWSSDNAAMISFPDGTIQPMSVAGGSPSLQMQVNGSGKVTITATHTRGCGSTASDSFTYVLSNDVTAVGWVNAQPGIAMVAALESQVNPYLPLAFSTALSCGTTIMNWRDAGNNPNTFVPTNLRVSAAVDRRYVNWWFEAQTGNNIPADQLNTASFGQDSNGYRLYQRFVAGRPSKLPMRSSANQFLRLFNDRYREEHFRPLEFEVHIEAQGLVQITGFPLAGLPA